jgi:ubiquinol-cytochrome c reductase iron-sulfur subunit
MTIEHRSAGHAAGDDFDVDDPALRRFDLVREGARRDGVEIVHYAPRLPAGSRVEKRAVRSIALLISLSGLLAIAFVVAYIWWPWKYEPGMVASKFYTPILAATLGGSLFILGLAIIAWAKKLLPEEISVQDRTTGRRRATSRSSPGPRSSTWSTRPASSAAPFSRRPSCCRPSGSARPPSPRWWVRC